MNANNILKTGPKVGVGVLVVKDGHLLLGERIHSHGTGSWCPPGGHLEFGESPEQCAARELLEETGLIAKEVTAGPWSNDYFEKEGKHYLTVFMIVNNFEGTPKVIEPEKCGRWEWFPFKRLPAPLFLSLLNLLKNHQINSLLNK